MSGLTSRTAHYCKTCVFLGYSKDLKYDLYYCDNPYARAYVFKEAGTGEERVYRPGFSSTSTVDTLKEYIKEAQGLAFLAGLIGHTEKQTQETETETTGDALERIHAVRL